MKMGWREWVMGVVAVMVAGSAIWADEEPQAADQSQRRTRTLAYRVAGKHWLGVHAVPVDEALKSQLGIQDRLILAHVIPDSPADKAGLKQHDILLRLGEREITSMPDLLTAVEKNEDRETTLRVLRQGKELPVTIQPSTQPNQELHLEWQPAMPGRVEWQQLFEHGRPLGLKVVGPGVFAFAQTEDSLPKDLSISVTKQGSEPAKLKVKRDDKTWEGTEDELDKCPEELRPYVERALGRNAPNARVHLRTTGPQDVLRLAPEPVSDPLRVEVRRVEERDPMQGLRQEIEALRRAIEKLEQQITPSDSTPEKR